MIISLNRYQAFNTLGYYTSYIDPNNSEYDMELYILLNRLTDELSIGNVLN